VEEDLDLVVETFVVEVVVEEGTVVVEVVSIVVVVMVTVVVTMVTVVVVMATEVVAMVTAVVVMVINVMMMIIILEVVEIITMIFEVGDPVIEAVAEGLVLVDVVVLVNGVDHLEVGEGQDLIKKLNECILMSLTTSKSHFYPTPTSTPFFRT